MLDWKVLEEEPLPAGVAVEQPAPNPGRWLRWLLAMLGLETAGLAISAYLVPRLIAGGISLPLLTAYADTIGIGAGMYTARATLGLGYETFIYGVQVFWHTFDLYYSVGKGFVFGLIIPLIAAHMGLRTYGGAEGVGRATTASVVFMIMAVLVLDATFPMIFLR